QRRTLRLDEVQREVLLNVEDEERGDRGNDHDEDDEFPLAHGASSSGAARMRIGRRGAPLPYTATARGTAAASSKRGPSTMRRKYDWCALEPSGHAARNRSRQRASS